MRGGSRSTDKVRDALLRAGLLDNFATYNKNFHGYIRMFRLSNTKSL
jgi:hypothetical protein